MHRDKLIEFINKALEVKIDKDPWLFNGLQVLGKSEVSKIALGVSPNLELFEQAATWGADMVILHHGLLGSKIAKPIGKVLGNRLKVLLNHEITLLTYHHFLDRHPVLGHNAQLIKLLGAEKGEEFGYSDRLFWGWTGNFSPAISINELISRLQKLCGKIVKIFKYGPEKIKKLAVLTGGGAYHLSEAVDQNLDVFITGEANETTEAWAKEAEIHHIYLGHYNSEKFGIQALGKLLKNKFPSLNIKFIDIPNNL